VEEVKQGGASVLDHVRALAA
jgi:hypothetical protein